MRKSVRTAGLVLGLFFWGGCYRMAVINGEPVPLVKENKGLHHGVLSLVEVSQVVPLSETCPNGFARVDDRVNFVNGLLSGLSDGVYSPSTVFVQCKDGQAHLLQLDDDGLVSQIIASTETGTITPLG
jgi:hypothetical protein